MPTVQLRPSVIFFYVLSFRNMIPFVFIDVIFARVRPHARSRDRENEAQQLKWRKQSELGSSRSRDWKPRDQS